MYNTNLLLLFSPAKYLDGKEYFSTYRHPFSLQLTEDERTNATKSLQTARQK
jgi:hypothetical protein